jgi:hypothetical protein
MNLRLLRLDITALWMANFEMTQLPQKPGCDRVYILIDKKSHS